MYYLSALGTGDGLWKFLDGQATEIWRGSQGALLEPAAVSPDGLRLAIILRKGSRRTLTILAADGTGGRAVAESIDVSSTVDWSPDGNWIVAGGRDSGGEGLFRIPVHGGDPERVAHGMAHAPVWSPAGDLIAYAGDNVGGHAPLLAVRPDGTPVELPDLQAIPAPGGSARFVPDGSALVFLRGARARDFWRLDLPSMQVRQLTNIATETDLGDIGSFDVTSDGRRIIFDRQRDNSDIRLIDLPAR